MRKSLSSSLLTFGIALLSALSIIISVNVIIRNDIETQSKEILGKSYEIYQKADFLSDTTINDQPIIINSLSDEQSTVTIRIIYRNLENQSFLYDHEAELLKLIDDNTFDLYTVHTAHINSNKIFFTFLDGSDDFVLYVNTGDYLYILEALNQIFVIITLIILLVSLFIGFRAGKYLENAEDKLKRFFNNASHELKTPLTSIQGYTESISLGITTDVNSSCEVVLNQCALMERLIEELLLISKLDSKALKLNLYPINIYEIIDRLLMYIKPISLEKNIDIICEFSGEEAVLLCDEKYMYNALNAIISNALRYAKTQIKVSAKIKNNNIIIIIHDDGEGISETDLPHIFKRFYVGNHGSTGVGLSLSKEIIELHKGSITAKNNKGAEFTIQFGANQKKKRN